MVWLKDADMLISRRALLCGPLDAARRILRTLRSTIGGNREPRFAHPPRKNGRGSTNGRLNLRELPVCRSVRGVMPMRQSRFHHGPGAFPQPPLALVLVPPGCELLQAPSDPTAPIFAGPQRADCGSTRTPATIRSACRYPHRDVGRSAEPGLSPTTGPVHTVAASLPGVRGCRTSGVGPRAHPSRRGADGYD